MPLQALCIISSLFVNSNWSYGPETVKLCCNLCDLDLWPLTLTFYTDIISVIGNNSNFMMIRWWEHNEKGVTDRQTDRRTDCSIHRAAWSQLKRNWLLTVLYGNLYFFFCYKLELNDLLPMILLSNFILSKHLRNAVMRYAWAYIVIFTFNPINAQVGLFLAMIVAQAMTSCIFTAKPYRHYCLLCQLQFIARWAALKNKIVINGQTRESFRKTHLERQTVFYTSPYTIWRHYTSTSPELYSAYMYGIVALPITPHSGLCESVPVYIGDIREELWPKSHYIQLGPISNAASALTAIFREISNLQACVGIFNARITITFGEFASGIFFHKVFRNNK